VKILANMFEINRHGLCGTLNVEKESVPNNKLEELVLQSSKCPITLDLESEDDVQTVRDQYEPMEVASTATTHFRIPRLKKSETTATVVTTSPLSSGKPKANLSLKGQLQLAEQRLASKNVAITAQAHQLETLDRKLQALQLELSSEKTKYHMLKTEADDAILKERQVSAQLRRENEYLQQQLKAHDQLALVSVYFCFLSLVLNIATCAMLTCCTCRCIMTMSSRTMWMYDE
jgi:hypothetical protein